MPSHVITIEDQLKWFNDVWGVDGEATKEWAHRYPADTPFFTHPRPFTLQDLFDLKEQESAGRHAHPPEIFNPGGWHGSLHQLNITCDQCRKEWLWIAVEVGEESTQESRTACVCPECLIDAVKAIGTVK